MANTEKILAKIGSLMEKKGITSEELIAYLTKEDETPATEETPEGKVEGEGTPANDPETPEATPEAKPAEPTAKPETPAPAPIAEPAKETPKTGESPELKALREANERLEKQYKDLYGALERSGILTPAKPVDQSVGKAPTALSSGKARTSSEDIIAMINKGKR